MCRIPRREMRWWPSRCPISNCPALFDCAAFYNRSMRYALLLAVLSIPLAAGDLKVDHVTAAGGSLKKLEAGLSAVGIPFVYGGPHRNHATEMALVSFPDGSYVELMAPQVNADP